MNPKIITGLVMVGLLMVYAAYDIYAYTHWGNEATISRILLETNAMTTAGIALAIVLAFTVGVAFGHFFLPQHVG